MTPAVEYTERNIECLTIGGNPSDPSSYNYGWMFKTTYGASDSFNRLPSGIFNLK